MKLRFKFFIESRQLYPNPDKVGGGGLDPPPTFLFISSPRLQIFQIAFMTLSLGPWATVCSFERPDWLPVNPCFSVINPRRADRILQRKGGKLATPSISAIWPDRNMILVSVPMFSGVVFSAVPLSKKSTEPFCRNSRWRTWKRKYGYITEFKVWFFEFDQSNDIILFTRHRKGLPGAKDV